MANMELGSTKTLTTPLSQNSEWSHHGFTGTHKIMDGGVSWALKQTCDVIQVKQSFQDDLASAH
jgi:hypothetical protein